MNSSGQERQKLCEENIDLFTILECDGKLLDSYFYLDNYTETSTLWISALLANVITPWSCVIGICVILATIAIIRSKCLGKSVNNYYFIGLGIVDVGSLTTILIISPPVLGFFIYSEIWKQLLAPHLSTFLQMTIFVSNWVTVALALDRHQAICKPFNYYSRSYTFHNKAGAIILIILGCLLLYIPQFFLYSDYITISTSNITYLIYSPLGLNKFYKTFHLWLVTFIFLLLLPTAIILFVNTHLVICVTSSTRLLYQSTNLNFSKSVKMSFTRENIKISVLLFCLITSFFCFQLPLVILIFLSNYQPSVFTNDFTYLFNKTVTFLYVLKHDINFLFYLWLSKRFMRTIQAFVCLNCTNMKRRGSSFKSRISSSKRKSSPV